MTILDFNTAKRQDELVLTENIDLRSIRERLHANPRAFVQWLYSGRAYTSKGEARIGNVMGEQGSSLGIDLATGLWKDHATDEGGDLITLYRAWAGYRESQDFVQSLKEIARDYLGDPVEVVRPPWRATPLDRIAEQKAKLGSAPRAENLELGAPVATYTYYDLHGKVIATVRRYEPLGTRASKTFRPWCFRDGKWVAGAPDMRPLYRLPQVAMASRVVLTEGEGCAEALNALGIVATTAMQGAKAPLDKTDWSPLAGKTVVIWPDKDEPGFQYARDVAARLTALSCTVLGVTPPDDRPSAWDAQDCVAEGGDVHGLINKAAPLHDAPPKLDPDTGQPLPLLLTATQFLKGFRSPDYLIDGILQRSYLWSLTARTGHGKTAIALLMGSCIARGVPFHGHPVEQGSVLFLAGENPDDIRARWLVLAAHEGFDPEKVPFFFVDGVIDIMANMPRIQREAANIANLSLVMVDTAAAYFRGDEANSNTQQGAYARNLRELIKLPGKPAVLVNCHPVKNALQDNLVPLGGSYFLNEIDGNLTLWADDRQCTLEPYPTKFRGAPFEPLNFELKTSTADKVKDAKGRYMPSVVAVPVTESGAERAASVREEDENAVLRQINADGNASFATIAKRAGFVSLDGAPSKRKVQGIIERLKDNKLVYKYRDKKYRLTKKGCKAIDVKWKEQGGDEE